MYSSFVILYIILIFFWRLSVISIENDYILKLYNKKLSVTLDKRGAAISAISFAKIANSFQNIALAVYKSCDLHPDSTYAGYTLGPVAGRVSNGLVNINNQTYQLTQNEGPNHLHGGISNLSSLLWEIDNVNSDENQVVFTCKQEDKTDGYPGNREYFVKYSIKDEATLRIEYKVNSDKDTYVSLSNHTYFNLSGDFTKPVFNSKLQIKADSVIYNDNSHIPYELNKVSGCFDFNKMKELDFRNKDIIMKSHPQLKNAMGYNNGYILDTERKVNDSVLTLISNSHEIRMDIATDQPCIVFYSGGYFDNSLLLADGSYGDYSCALAFEAQDWPDALNFKDAPKNILKASQTYSKFIEYRFS